MVDFDAESISALLKEVQQLFQAGKAKMQPSPVASLPVVKPSAQEVPASGGQYQAPIHGSWKSSGGFDPNMKRPGGRIGHFGVDLRAPGGTPVYPMAAGIVSSVEIDPRGGNVVYIQHDGGISTYYAHLGSISVHKGDKVSTDTPIATVGDSGNAKGTWPHCHFQVSKDGQTVNPANYFAVPPASNPGADDQMWLPGQKEVARSWKMSDHLQQQRVAFTRGVEQLGKVCAAFESLTARHPSKKS